MQLYEVDYSYLAHRYGQTQVSAKNREDAVEVALDLLADTIEDDSFTELTVDKVKEVELV